MYWDALSTWGTGSEGWGDSMSSLLMSEGQVVSCVSLGLLSGSTAFAVSCGALRTAVGCLLPALDPVPTLSPKPLLKPLHHVELQ